MSTAAQTSPSSPPPVKKRDWKFIILTALGVLVSILLVVCLVLFFFYRSIFHADAFDPVELKEKEKVELQEKLTALEEAPPLPPREQVPTGLEANTPGELAGRTPEELQAELEKARKELPKPEVTEDVEEYTKSAEEGTVEERRRVILTERELNSLLHNNTDLGDKVYISLTPDRIRAGAVVPMDPDVPFVGGKTLKGKVTMRAYLDETGRLAVYVDDITFFGIPLPNAWIGQVKGKNLVTESVNGNRDPFLKNFADGISHFEIRNGEIEVILNE